MAANGLGQRKLSAQTHRGSGFGGLGKSFGMGKPLRYKPVAPIPGAGLATSGGCDLLLLLGRVTFAPSTAEVDVLRGHAVPRVEG
jgi:hypothetical protein